MRSDPRSDLYHGITPRANAASFMLWLAACHRRNAELRVLGDWAWLRNHIQMSMTPAEGGAPVRRAGYTLTLLAKGPDRKWRLTRDANLLAQVE